MSSVRGFYAFMLLLLLSALYSVQLQLYNVYSIGVPSCFVLTAVNTVISVQPSHNAVVFASALFLSAAYVITDQICKFRIPGLLTLFGLSPPISCEPAFKRCYWWELCVCSIFARV